MSTRALGGGSGIAASQPALDTLKETPTAADSGVSVGVGGRMAYATTFSVSTACHAVLLGAVLSKTAPMAGTYRLALYSDATGLPGTLLAASPPTQRNTLPTTPTNIGGVIPSTPLLAGTTYWFALETSEATTDGIQWATDSASSQSVAAANTSPPSDWSDGGTHNTPLLSVLGTYDA